jgi:hypothetical protein
MSHVNIAFTGMMSTATTAELAARDLSKRLDEIGPSEAVAHFVRSYAKVTVQSLYALHLCLYFRWLRNKKGVEMTPDELVRDDLRCIYKSEPEDVATKRRRRALLEEYVNQELITSHSESYRRQATAAAKVSTKRTTVRGDEHGRAGASRDRHSA